MVDITVVYRNTVSTEYLLKGVYDINGKHLDTLDELDYFYNHYEETFRVYATLTRQQLESDIARVDRELTILNDMYLERASLRAWAIDSRIQALENQAFITDTGVEQLRLRARLLGLKLFRNTYINRPLRGLKEEIHRKENDMDTLMKNGAALIEGNYKKLMETYNFIHSNRMLLENAKRESEVLNTLSRLGDDYHVINNFSLEPKDRLPVKIARKPLPSPANAQMVVGPTGLFTIIMMPPGDLKGEESQVLLRQAICLDRSVKEFLNMNDIFEYEVKHRTALVTFGGGYSGVHTGESVDVVSLDRLSRYLKRRNTRLTAYTVDEMVQLFNR